MKRKCKIVSVTKKEFRSECITRGIKQNNQSLYDNSNYYHGSNGTYASDIQVTTDIEVFVRMYETEEYEQEEFLLYIKEYALYVNNMQKLSPQLFDFIKLNNQGKKIWIDWEPGMIGDRLGTSVCNNMIIKR